MENQHRKITGYRELTQADIDLMNKIKAHAVATEALSAEVKTHVSSQYDATAPVGESRTTEQQAGIERLMQAEPHRWLAISRTDFQTGFMALTRAVAQPTTF